VRFGHRATRGRLRLPVQDAIRSSARAHAASLRLMDGRADYRQYPGGSEAVGREAPRATVCPWAMLSRGNRWRGGLRSPIRRHLRLLDPTLRGCRRVSPVPPPGRSTTFRGTPCRGRCRQGPTRMTATPTPGRCSRGCVPRSPRGGAGARRKGRRLVKPEVKEDRNFSPEQTLMVLDLMAPERAFGRRLWPRCSGPRPTRCTPRRPSSEEHGPVRLMDEARRRLKSNPASFRGKGGSVYLSSLP